MQPWPRFTVEEVQYIRRQLVEDPACTFVALAAKFKVSQNTISRAAYGDGALYARITEPPALPRREVHRLSEQEIEEMRKLRAERTSYRKIGTKFGVTATTAWNHTCDVELVA